MVAARWSGVLILVGGALSACDQQPPPRCSGTTIAVFDMVRGELVMGDELATTSLSKLRQVGGETWLSSGADTRLIDDSGAVSEPLAGYLYRFAVGDLDNDGDLDAVHFRDKSLRLLERVAADRLVERSVLEVLHFEHDLVVADVDDDGDLDILLSPLGGLWVLLGDGAFGFQVTRQRWGGDDAVAFRGATDANDDGRLDFVVVHTPRTQIEGDPEPTAAVSVWLGRGDGAFDEPISSPLGHRAHAVASELVDFDQDGALDVVFWSDDLMLAPGLGDGTFAPPVILSSDLRPLGPESDTITVYDVDRDGAAVLVLINDATLFTVNRQPGGEVQLEPTALPSGDFGPIGQALLATRVNSSSPLTALALSASNCPVQ